MIAHLIAVRAGGSQGKKPRWRPEGQPVRLSLVTWPTVVFFGATVAAAACLVGDCAGQGRTHARETRVAHVGSVQSVAYRSDGKLLSSIGADGSFMIWGLRRHANDSFLPEGPGRVCSAAFSPDNRVLATGNLTATVALHDLVERESLPLEDSLEATSGALCLAFAADGATLAVGQQDGHITLWESSTGFKRSTLEGHDGFVASLSMAQHGTTLASSGGDHSVRIWDSASGRERFSIHSPGRTYAALAISPDGRLLALGDRVNPVVRIWDLATESERAVLRGPAGAVVGVAISHDGATLAAADYKGFVTFWDLATLQIQSKRLKHSGVLSLAFAPDGHTLTTGGFDGTIHLWDFPIAAAQ
jgi:WD40 repeat protein